MKKSTKLISSVSLLGVLSLLVGGTLLLSNNSNVEVKDEEISAEFVDDFSPSGNPVFYPASYSINPDDETHYSQQYNLTFSPASYTSRVSDSYRGESVKVAVIDSGIIYNHEDFVDSNDVTIINVDSGAISSYGTHYPFGNSDNNKSKLLDTLGHGSNVASVIASQLNNIGCAGIAPNVDLYVYKVTNTSNGYEWNAIKKALNLCIQNGVDIVNMSFQAYEHSVTYNGSTMGASQGCSSVLTDFIDACYNSGITLIAAAGNYNTSEPSYPASNNHVISVGSLQKATTDTKAGYSNTYGIDLVAPGSVYVAEIGSTSSYKETQGTSFSAPIVTAAAALYKQQNPDATPDQIETALKNSCDSISGNPSWAGSGRLNIEKLLNLNDGAKEITLNHTDSIELTVGDTFQLDWTVSGLGTFDDSVSIYSCYDNVSVSNSGLITALSEGEDLVYIESNENPNVYVGVYVNVVEPVTGTLTLTPETLSLYVDETSQLNATANPATSISYSSSDTTVATVSSSGLVTAKKVGTATITASANGVKKTCEVTVKNSVKPSGTLNYTLIKNTSTLKTGDYVVIKTSADLGVTGASTKDATVSSTESDWMLYKVTTVTNGFTLYDDIVKNYIASPGGNEFKYGTAGTCSVNSDGVLKCNSRYLCANGTNYRFYTSIGSYTPFYVYLAESAGPEVTSITLDKSSIELDLNGTITSSLTPTVVFDAGADTTVTYTLSTSGIVSLNKTTATKDESIHVTALAVGSVTITAKAGKKSATCNVAVADTTPIPATNLTLSQSSASLVASSTLQLTATITPTNATIKTLNWSSSNENVATVDSTGLVSVKNDAIVGQTTTITVSTTDGSDISQTCLITVIEKVVLSSIEFEDLPTSIPYKSSLELGNYKVKANYSDGSSNYVTNDATVDISGISTSILGLQPVTASYTEEGITKNVTSYIKITTNGAVASSGKTSQTLETSSTSTNLDVNDEQIKTLNPSVTSVTSAKVTFTCAYTGSGTYTHGVTVKLYGPNNSEIASKEITVTASNGNGRTFVYEFSFDSPVTIAKASYSFTTKQSGSNIRQRSFSIEMNYGDPNFANNEAKAWATYFLNQIKPECQMSGSGSNLTNIASKWSDLSSEYSTMVSEAKNAFVSSDDVTIVEARTLYGIIIQKYSSQPGITNFVTDGSGVLLDEVVSTYFSPVSTETASIVLIVVISLVAISSIVAYVYINNHKRK